MGVCVQDGVWRVYVEGRRLSCQLVSVCVAVMLGRTFSKFLRHGSFEALLLLLISRQLLYFNKLYMKQFCLHHLSSVLSSVSRCFTLQCTLDYMLLVASNTTGVCSMWPLEKFSHTPAALR